MQTTLKHTAAEVIKSEIVMGHIVVSSFTKLHAAAVYSKAGHTLEIKTKAQTAI